MKRKSKPGIALFILMTALILLSLLVRELISSAANQATRVRNSVDRIQALYLARSGLNLARFILAIDRFSDSQLYKDAGQRSDRLDEFWALPNYFPLKAEEIKALTLAAGADPNQQQQTEQQGQEGATGQNFTKKCEELFEGFPGEATSITTDLSSLLNLNDLGKTPAIQLEVLTELLRPNIEFIRHLNEINITPENLAKEIKDYADPDDIEESNAPESSSYAALQLDYGPKNRPYFILDELKLVPHVDDYVFSYLAPSINPYYRPLSMRTVAAKINLNTVGRDLFQALLKETPDADILSREFIKDRVENKRIYTEKNAMQILTNALRLESDKVRSGLITGTSDSFKIETVARVNRIELKLETIVARPTNLKKVEPILLMRISP